MVKMTGTLLAVLALAAMSAACEDEDSSITGNGVDTVTVTVRDTIRIGNTTRSYVQIERLGNPLVSEVFVEKREHGHYNADSPSEDNANFRDDIVAFITGVAGRDAAYANTVAGALVGSGDMLVVRLDKTGGGPAGANVGWLTYALDPANGYGGRKLTGDDVVDKGLSVIFGAALGNTANVSAGLVTDNVDANDKAHSTTFPYLAAAN
jgi:hypothetical protein